MSNDEQHRETTDSGMDGGDRHRDGLSEGTPEAVDDQPVATDPLVASEPGEQARRDAEQAALRTDVEQRGDGGAAAGGGAAAAPAPSSGGDQRAAGDKAGERLSLFGVVKRTFKEFSEDDAMSYAAAVAFYTALSFAPLIVLLLAAITLFYGDAAKANLVGELRAYAGEGVAGMAEQAIANADKQPGVASFSGVIALATLLFSATGVFAQLQHALNFMWDVKQKPGGGVGGFVRKRLLSLGMLLTIGFLLLVSLGLTAFLQATFGKGDGGAAGAFWLVFNNVMSLAVFVGLFAAMFKVLPDVDVQWRDVWIGAAITAGLFVVGKWAIGKYMGITGTGSAYGAAGSLLVLLVWVYYSAIILFIGAEFTQVWAKRQGRTITPDEHAVWRNC